ncbi:MAG: radical SAM protein [Elusimicrobia bacterium]|nr:radical SAM protein [Elusimicrobiota bacterium]
MSRFTTVPPAVKLQRGMLPFLTIPLTRNCNLRCRYCGYGGEAASSAVAEQDYEWLKGAVLAARRLGIGKFRLTGGEPFLYPRIADLLRFFSDLDVSLLVNTNATLLEPHGALLASFPDRVRFAVSLDTLIPGRFDVLVGTPGRLAAVHSGIAALRRAGRLYRLNMVVSRINEDEVFSMIDYCAKLSCGLKLLDVASVPMPYGKWDDLHVPLAAIEEKLAAGASSVKEHEYARNFGTPCSIYSYRGIDITVRSIRNGSHYDLNGICKGCPSYPCHEGLYDIFLQPDRSIAGCRWRAAGIEQAGGDLTEKFRRIAEVFQRAAFVPRGAGL